jgi:CYTH domain-containing protein
MLHRALLRSPSDVATRALLLDAIEQVRDARRALTERAIDADAVHTLRVALTRLRAISGTWPTAADELLGLDASRAIRRAHRALASLRADDVRRAQLSTYVAATPLEPRETSAHNTVAHALIDRLARRRRHRAARVERAIARTLDPMFERSAATAIAPDASVSGHEDEAGHGVFARDLERAVHHAVQAVLDHAADDQSDDAHHRTRLALKRLRALITPWIDAEPALGPLLRVATSGQDAFGDERDLEQLRAFVTRASRQLRRHARHRGRKHRHALAADARALRLALRERQHLLAHQLADEWLLPHGASRSALHLTAATASAALRAARPTLVVEAHDAPVASSPQDADTSAPQAATMTPAPDALSVEIERKFLLSGLPDAVRERDGIRIAQGWLPGERLRERLRRSVFPGGRVEWTRTIKLGAGVSRIEVEEATDPILFESLWPFTAAARIEKLRYVVPDGSLTWEIDRFLDRDLVLAEVELPSADATATPPEWLAPYIVREVTDEAEFVNANLARCRPPHPTT